MTEHSDIDRFLGSGRVRKEHPDLAPMARRLEQERPVPRAGFRAKLRRRLLETADRQSTRPQRLRFLIAAYAGSGIALLAIAVLGVAGAGPLAAG
jgi:hypothetical protein